MKTYLFALSVLSASVLSAHAADGTINFTGSVIDPACTATASNANVAMGSISKSALSSVGATSQGKQLAITLSSCPAAATKATITFSGTPDDTNSSLLKVTAADSNTAATGIGIALYEENGSTLIPLNTASSSKTLSATNDTVYNFIAKYMATNATITGGDANSSVSYTINYN
ncbi:MULTISPECIES: fimbrial protein [Enterobacter]|uniref:fimbrial protein n=1 Tax=Enterobacter TaxID=547 RepID=UPI001F337EC7|nr:fimbrial protein [Enterobacter quasiroggenkampii]